MAETPAPPIRPMEPEPVKTNGVIDWQTAALRGLRSLVRLVVLAVPGIAITALTDLPQTTTIVVLTALLQAVDVTIHNSTATSLNGLVPKTPLT